MTALPNTLRSAKRKVVGQMVFFTTVFNLVDRFMLCNNYVSLAFCLSPCVCLHVWWLIRLRFNCKKLHVVFFFIVTNKLFWQNELRVIL